jgi:hypothetical protein
MRLYNGLETLMRHSQAKTAVQLYEALRQAGCLSAEGLAGRTDVIDFIDAHLFRPGEPDGTVKAPGEPTSIQYIAENLDPYLSATGLRLREMNETEYLEWQRRGMPQIDRDQRVAWDPQATPPRGIPMPPVPPVKTCNTPWWRFW